jgi:hypothetical protein
VNTTLVAEQQTVLVFHNDGGAMRVLQLQYKCNTGSSNAGYRWKLHLGLF